MELENTENIENPSINEEENNPLDGDVDMDLVNQILNSSVGDSNG